MRPVIVLASGAAALALGGCETLEPLDATQCGNAVVEPTEDCDTHPQGEYLCRKSTEPSPCRYDCRSGAPCKPGFVCNPDEVCRRQSLLAFGASAASFAADADVLLAADFDGDGRTDALTSNEDEVRVQYLSGAGQPEAAVVIAGQAPFPSIGDLTGDGLPDIAVNAARGLGVFRGRADRTFAPTPYASIPIPVDAARIVGMEAVPGLPGDDPIAVIEVGGATNVISVAIDSPVPIDIVKGLPPLATLFTGVPVGPIIEDPVASACDELVLGFHGDASDVILVVTPCSGSEVNDVTGPTPIPPRVIEIPKGWGGGGLHLFDLNGDAHLDMLIGGDYGVLFAAYGLGDGEFTSDPSVPPAVVDNTISVYEPFPFKPLAVAHLDGDGRPDFVDEYAIWMSLPEVGEGAGGGGGAPGGGGAGGSGAAGGDGGAGGGAPPVASSFGYYPAVFNLAGATWSEALVGDFNGNGIPDVAIATRYNTGIDFYSGAGDGYFNQFVMPTQGIPEHLTAGDFDGDVLVDLAFSEQPASTATDSPGGTAPTDALAVCFGRQGGAPEPPLDMGRLGDIRQMVSARFLDPATLSVDGIWELGVLSATFTADEEQVLSFAVLDGSTDRQLQSPVTFEIVAADPLREDNLVYVPTRSVIGELDGSAAAHADIAVLAFEVSGSDVSGSPAPTGGAGGGLGGGGFGAGGAIDVTPDLEGPPHRLWLAASVGDAELPASTIRAGDALPPDLGLPSVLAKEEGSLLASVDLDGDSIDELVYLASRIDFSVEGDGALGGALLVARSVTDEEGARWSHGEPTFTTQGFIANPSALSDFLELDLSHRGEARIVAGDLDGDGRVDVAALGFVLEGEAPGGFQARSEVVVFWHTGDPDPLLALRADARVVVPAPPGSITAIAPANLDADAALELVLLTETAGYLVDFTLRDPGQPALLEGLPGGKSLTAADFTADGFVDVLVGHTDGTVTLHPGLALEP